MIRTPSGLLQRQLYSQLAASAANLRKAINDLSDLKRQAERLGGFSSFDSAYAGLDGLAIEWNEAGKLCDWAVDVQVNNSAPASHINYVV